MYAVLTFCTHYTHYILLLFSYFVSFKTRTMDAQRNLYSLKSRTFGFGQANWAYRFWDIFGIFGQTISTHFVTVSPSSMLFIIYPLFLQNKLSLYIHIPNIFMKMRLEFGLQRIRDLAFVCP